MDLAQQLALHYELADRASARSFSDFLDYVVIDSVPPRRFGSISEYWQRDRFARLGPALEFVSGHNNLYDGPLNFWEECSKGHDKTSSLARALNWVCAYAKRPLRAYACAADSDQAALIRDAMDREAKLNPWLKARVDIKGRWGYGDSGSHFEILAADAASAHGKSPDILILDELTHWEGKEFFDAIYSARDKRPRCLTFVITNAGVKRSWQWQLREIASRSDAWSFYAQPQGKQLASWMNADAIAESRKMLTASEARRLHDNVWIDPGEECGYVTLSEAEQCEDETLTARTVGVKGAVHFAGVDYGERRDRTALAVLHANADGTVTLDRLDCWQGSPEQPIQIADLERWIEQIQKTFYPVTFVVDPHQMVGTIQKYRDRGFSIETWESRGGKKNYELAANLRQLILSRRLRWPRGCGSPSHPHSIPRPSPDDFTSELASLITRTMSYGYRFDHESGAHDDRAVAVGMAALFAVQTARTPLSAPSPIQTPSRSLDSLPWAASRGLFGVAR